VIRPGSEISLGIDVIIRVLATCNNKSKMRAGSVFHEANLGGCKTAKEQCCFFAFLVGT